MSGSAGSHDVYLTHRDLIERALSLVCRRHRLSGADGEDFSSTCRLHLMADDYAVIRAFQGRSSLQTYLITVVTHYFQDWRNARWGKWRPSSAAKRLGPLAVRLETMTGRDGLTLDQAQEVLRSHFGVTESREALEEMASRFPRRSGRTFVSDDSLDERPAPDTRADAPLHQREAETIARSTTAMLADTVRRLAPQDRLILRMRFEDGRSIADIARTLQLEAKPLYRRLEALLAALRLSLERGGLTAAAAVEALEAGGFDTLQDAEGAEGRELWGEVRPFDRSGRSSLTNAGVK